MRHEHRMAIERWLESGAPETASVELESAWTRLLSELPDESPSGEFPARVMLRVAGSRRPARDLSPRLRLALVACLGLVGVFALALPALLLAFPLPVGSVIDTLAVAVKAGAAWTAQALAVWTFLAGVAQTLSVVLATPEAAAFLLSFALLSAAALRLLFELTRKDRRIADAAAR
jgi:hypothetical protein